MRSDRLKPDRMGVPQRVRAAHVQWVAERLSERDRAVLEIVNRLRLVRADQLERLFFAELAEGSRSVSRGRVLHRLVAWRVLDVLPRRIGGSPVYALGPAGQRLLVTGQRAAGTRPRVRHPGAPVERTIRHALAVSELYTGLVEHSRLLGAVVARFEAEPACWWPDGLGGQLKPDAYLALQRAAVRDHWWIEADLATESLPTLRRKLLTYLSFVERGQLGPGDVIPRVLVMAPGEQRVTAIRSIGDRLPDPASTLFAVVTERHAPDYLMQVLLE